MSTPLRSAAFADVDHLVDALHETVTAGQARTSLRDGDDWIAVLDPQAWGPARPRRPESLPCDRRRPRAG